MISASVEREVQRRLDRARVIAEAPAGLVRVGRAHPGSGLPTSAGPSTLDRLAGALAGVSTDRSARRWIKFADEVLHEVTHGPERKPETPAQFRYRICTEYEGQPAASVARRELTSITTVRKIRAEAGRDPSRGRKQPGVSPD